jgi:chitin synthase
VPELISQRRRWLNGSFFAAIHSVVKFGYIYRSSHSFTRKFWIHIELFYQTYNLLFSWFALGNFYIAFIILSQSMESLLPQVHVPNIIMRFLYLGLLTMCFLLSMGNRPQGYVWIIALLLLNFMVISSSKWAYTTAMIGFGFITIYMTVSKLYS